MNVDEQVQGLLDELQATTDYGRAAELLRLLDGFGIKGALELRDDGGFDVQIEEPLTRRRERQMTHSGVRPAPAGTGSESRGEIAVFAARVPIVTTRGLDMTPAEQEKIAFDPDFLRANPPYCFRGHCSTDQEDAYFTRMHASSLRNYAQDAADGVALQNSHRSEQLPFGHSFRGRYIQPHEHGDQIAKTLADFYVVPGLRLSDVSNDDLIMGVKSGSVRDLSVGFYGGKYRCTLCRRDLLRDDDERCDHVPGLVYRVKVGKEEQEELTAAVWVHDARLAEVSTVYDGATPGATIVKARRMAEAGRLNWQQARLLEQRYRMRFYGSQRYFAGVGPGRQEAVSEPPMPRYLPQPSEYDDGFRLPPSHRNEMYMG